jgi:hypothetical protein
MLPESGRFKSFPADGDGVTIFSVWPAAGRILEDAAMRREFATCVGGM